MNTWPLKPMGIGGILDKSFQFYRKNFVQLFLIALIFLGSLMLLQNVLGYDYGGMSFLPSGGGHSGSSGNVFEGFLQDFETMQGAPSAGEILWKLLGMLLVSLVAIALTPVMCASVVVLVKSVAQGERPGLGEVLRGGFRRYWRLLGWSVLFGLIVMGIYFAAFMAFGIVVFMGALVSGISGGSEALGLVIMVAGVVLMALAILGSVAFFCIRLGFFLPVIAADNQDQVFTRSWRLTRGSFWRLLAIFLIVHIVSYIIIYGFQFLLLISSAWTSIIGQLLLILFTAAITPLSLVVFSFVYFDLKARTEGQDLQDMIRETLARPGDWAGPAAEINTEG